MAADPARQGCAECVNRERRESVDRGARGSLPWTDDAKSLVPGSRSRVCGRCVWLRGCWEEACAGARSGASASADKDGRRQGANGNGAAAASAAEFPSEAGGVATAATTWRGG